MSFKLSHIAIFFLSTALCAILLIPTGLDRAIIFRNSYMYDQALAQLDRLESKRPVHDSAIFSERLDNLYGSGRYNETAELLEKRLRLNPDDTVSLRRLARTYITIMDPDNIVRTFEKIIELSPADSEALYQLDTYYQTRQQTEPRITNLLRLIRFYPHDLEKWRALTELFIGMGRLSEAVNTLEKATAIFPDSLQLSAELGRILVYNNQETAYGYVSRLHERFPDRGDIFDLMVQALLNRREYSRAIEQVRLYYRPRLNPDAYRNYITVLMERIPDKETVLQFLEEQAADNPPPEIRFWLANLYWNDNRNSDALGLVRMVAREKPEEKRYWELYLSLLWEEEYKKELKDALEEFCRRWPEDLERRLQLAQAYAWNGDYESEVETLRGLAAEDPSRTVYVLMEARALNNLGRHEAAARILDELVGTYPDSTGFRQAMLETVKAIPDGDIKEIYIKKLYLSADGKDTEAAFLMATGYAQAGKTAEAVRILQEICTSHYNDIGVLVRAGELCRSSQLAEPAAGYYRKALALAPDNETALIGLAELSAEKEPGVSRANLERLESRSVNDAELTWRMALLYDSIQESETAVLYYGRYLDLAERTTADSYSLRRKAWALHRTGRTDKALELYRKLVLDSPGDRDLVNDYAEALIADKQYDKALLELDKVKP